jgi:hypothetical protein
MLDELLQILDTVGQVVDTPASMLRTGIARRSIGEGLEAAWDWDDRSSGRDVLESLGVLGQNQPGLDWGDAAGVAAEFALDPTNIVGAGLLGKIGRYVPELRAANEAERAWTAAKALETGGHNLGVDSAYRKLDDMLAARQPAFDGPVITASEIPQGLREVWTKAHPDVTDQQLLAIARGAPHEVGDAILGLKGSRRLEPHPVAKALADRAGISAIGHPLIDTSEGQLRGFVPTDRPDVMFVGDQPLPSTINASVHELLHSISGRDQATYQNMVAGLGDQGLALANRDRFGSDPLAALMSLLSEGPKVHREEALAHVLGNSAMRGASRQRFPVTDALNVDWRDVEPEFSSLIRERYPGVSDPNVIAKGWLESVFDRPRGHDLIPVSGLQNIDRPPVSFADDPLMTLDELSYIKTGYHEPPGPAFQTDDRNRAFPYLLALLGAFNTAAAPERFNPH